MQMQKDQLRNVLLAESAVINNIFLNKYNSTYFIIDKMGQEISSKLIADESDDQKSKQYLNKILNKYKTDSSLNKIFAWTIFSWANQNHQITVDGEYGIMATPFDLSNRDYVHQSKLTPNQMLFGKVVSGSTSKKWMIPGGVGFVDKNKNFIGTLTIGLEIQNLAETIQENIRDNNITAYLTDMNQSVIFSVNKTSINLTPPNEIVSYKSNIIDQKLVLDQKLENFPYHIILQYKDQAINNMFWNIIYSRLPEMILIIILSTALVAIIYQNEKSKRRKISFLIEKYTKIRKSKTEFMLRINHDLMNLISAIKGLCGIIKTDLTNDGTMDDGKIQENIGYLDHIDDISQELRTSITDLIEMNQPEDGKFEILRSDIKIDFEDIIDRSIRILQDKIRQKNIIIDTNFDDNLYQLPNLDPRRLKQIIVGIIGNSINHSANNSKIEINARNFNHKKVQIIIKDCGSGMSEVDIKNALANFDITKYQQDEYHESIETQLPIIRFLIEKMCGSIQIKSTQNYGTEVKIIF